MRKFIKSLSLFLVIALVGSALIGRQFMDREVTRGVGELILLIPDELSLHAPQVRLWRDAAEEEGIKLTAVNASQWVRSSAYFGNAKGKGLVLPDTFHRRMSDAAVAQVDKFVRTGGRLMLVYDTGLLRPDGSYSQQESRLSKIAGVVYGNYSLHRDELAGQAEVEAQVGFLDMLHLPPGRYRPVKSADASESSDSPWPFNDRVRLIGYGKQFNKFPVLKTERTTVQIEPLMVSPHGDSVAHIYRYGLGKTLFVNLPLTYLKQQTDSVLLHGFLGYFAREIVGLPTLANTPAHQGVLVLNWHNDDGLAIHYLKELGAAGVFAHGHQSMHFTVGPDVNEPGDGKGMNLESSPEAQAVAAKLIESGHTIGNHGGWIHNLFGHTVSDENGDEYQVYLDRNDEVLRSVVDGKPILEYSAPMGNQPLWVHDWLEQRSNLAYYTTSNVGGAPTRVWMGERRMGGGWGFPVMTNGGVASAEEAFFSGMSHEAFGAWLTAVGDFIERQRVMRLSYFHPVGARIYLPQVKAYIDQIQGCSDRQHCRFMSMTEAAVFLNRRLLTEWHIEGQPGQHHLRINNPEGLQDLSWLVPRRSYQSVTVLEGQAEVVEGDNDFVVHLKGDKQAALALKLRPNEPLQ